MKIPDAIKYLPENWTDEERIQYEIYIADAKRIFNQMDDYVIHIGVMAYINQQKGLTKDYTEQDVKDCKDKYDLTMNTNIIMETPYDDTFKMEDTLKPVIYTES